MMGGTVGVMDAIIRQAIERAVAARARCAAVCREVARRWAVGLAEAAATECAEAIDRSGTRAGAGRGDRVRRAYTIA